MSSNEHLKPIFANCVNVTMLTRIAAVLLVLWLLTFRRVQTAPMERHDDSALQAIHSGFRLPEPGQHWPTPPSPSSTDSDRFFPGPWHSTPSSTPLNSFHEPLSWALDVDTPSAELEDVDFDILRALSADFAQYSSSSNQPSVEPSAGLTGAMPTSETSGAQRPQVTIPASRPARTKLRPSPQKAAAIERHRVRNAAIRTRIGWPEPSVFSRLDHYAPFRSPKKQLTFADSPLIPARIIDAFGGKLRWVSLSRDMLTKVTFHDRSPYKMYSRRLPLAFQQHDVRWSVHMTQHNVPIRQEGLTRGTSLHGKPYYAFWGVPEDVESEFLPVVHYGAGVLEKEDNEAVDRRLRSLIEELEGRAA
ncbi:hypothetical protein PSEUBRA_005091 [Kalmanozyma brasiliensis GHG001]|uniref:uncharacterized protein n=1 Tax=Kalmanozyma brasiliensis (strain GHG001) TaxID=1365824 RepID=UPI00286800D8|nr:uncharacterized protein PSEUBRA_005091 [Kalmanozyma brasiliensis GHG001]KAF6767476.1 hypothetical protein PSEUBRA_005091 [Kalmanozyma brasiliensis GHG001]